MEGNRTFVHAMNLACGGKAWLDQYGEEMPARAAAEMGLHLHNLLEAHVVRREAERIMLADLPASPIPPG